MHIERIEIFGFKSFSRKTEMALGPGLSVIMGPNGCGKSNIFDGIRWAIGEQRLSLLRSSLLEDVIFKGSAGMRPLNFAEVSVQLAQAQGLLPHDPQTDRIQITRRTFRDGESQFRINGNPVRLKDIRGILSTVGLGDVGYAVIEQAMIERILGGGAEERRILFEQAAGIMKYKSDKAATQSKLKATEEDLVRLEDILREVQEQEAILKRQVRRAKQYKKIRENIHATELSLAAGRLGRYESENAEAQENVKRTQRVVQELSAKLAETRAKIQKVTVHRNEAEQHRNNLAEKHRGIDRDIADAERESAVMRERIENAQNLIAASKNNREALSARTTETAKQKNKLTKTLTEFEKKLDKINGHAAQLQEELDEKNSFLLKLGNRKSEIVQKDGKLREMFADITNRVAFAEEEIKKLSGQRKSSQQRIAQRSEELEKKRSEADSIGTRIDEITGEINGLNVDITRLKETRASLYDEFQNAIDEISGTTQRRSELLGRVRELEAIVTQGKDVGSTAHILIKKKKKTGIIGIVAEMVTIKPEYTAAAEMIMGERVNFLVVESIDEALSTMKEIPPESGEVGFIILSELSTPKEIPSWFSSSDLRLAALVSGVQVKQQFPPEEITAFTNTRVSSDGRILRSPGELRVVSGQPKSGAIAIRAQIERFHEEIGKIERELSLHSEKREKLNKRIEKIEFEIANTEKEITDKQILYNKKHREFEWASAGNAQIEKSIEQMKEWNLELTKSVDKLESDIEKWNNNLGEISGTRGEIGKEMGKLNARIADLETVRRESEEKCTAIQVERVGMEGEIRHAKQDIENAHAAEADAVMQLDKLQKSIVEAKDAIEASEKKIGERETQIQKYFSQRDEIENKQEKIRGELDKINESLDEMGKIERETSLNRDAEQEKLTDAEKKLSALEAAIAQVRKTAIEELGDIPSPTEPLSEQDETALQRKLTNYQRRLEQAGAVNLEAEEQYEVVNERLNFLTEQKSDIVNSIGNLKITITRLDEEAKRLFITTFDEARKNFADVFAQLFDGGEASLSMENPDDPLNSDILIKVKPVGKRQLNLSQLSAGEKALTSLALLFGLYLVKPSPFCLMDEVDAPLDDVNVDRFLRLVQSFCDKVQFIIISHNKRTLEKADYLYGVSMERDGVSKVLSMKMSDLRLELV